MTETQDTHMTPEQKRSIQYQADLNYQKYSLDQVYEAYLLENIKAKKLNKDLNEARLQIFEDTYDIRGYKRKIEELLNESYVYQRSYEETKKLLYTELIIKDITFPCVDQGKEREIIAEMFEGDYTIAETTSGGYIIFTTEQDHIFVWFMYTPNNYKELREQTKLIQSIQRDAPNHSVRYTGDNNVLKNHSEVLEYDEDRKIYLWELKDIQQIKT